MRVKKAQTPANPVRYLLSVDRTLRRISLKKIPVRVKKAANRMRASRQKVGSARKTNRSGSTAHTMNAWTSSRAMVFVLLGIGAAALLIGAPRVFQASDTPDVAAQATDNAPTTTEPLAPPPDTANSAAKPVAASVSARMHASDAPAASARTNESMKPPAPESAAKPEPVAKSASSTPAEPKAAEPKGSEEPSAHAAVQDSGTVTISGCLQGDDQGFWLKDTSGADAPKSRSWKSGFFKKHAASVEVLDPTDTLKLSNYVGQRVWATGTLTNRRMEAHSLQRIAASCN